MAGRELIVVGSILATAAMSAGVAVAAPGDPVKVELATCEPWQCGTLNGVTGDCPGTQAGGYGNTALDRQTRFSFIIVKRDPNDKKSDEVANTKRIEVCRVVLGVGEICPGTPGFVLFDSADPSKQLLESMVRDTDVAPLADPIALPIDFDAPDASFFTIRINGKGNVVEHLAEAGFCTPFQKLAPIGANDTFQVYGIQGQPGPLGLDPCTEAAKVNWNQVFGPPYELGTTNLRNGCITPLIGQWLYVMMLSEEKAQQQRAQASLAQNDRQSAAYNGAGHPFRLFLGPHNGGGGNAGPGDFYGNVDDFRQIAPFAAPTAQPASVTFGVAVATHEFYHEMQRAWRGKSAAKDLHIDLLAESDTASVELGLCMKDFPGAGSLPPGDPRVDCLNAGKLGRTDAGPYLGSALLADPYADLLAQPYAGALFFQYLHEQFSWPVNQPPGPTAQKPHPSPGIASVLPRALDADAKTLSDRQSDEGMDLQGLLLQAWATQGGSGLTILDKTLQDKLGRSLADVMLDFSTAMVLKDYVDTNPRWRFDWTHGDGFFAKTRLADGKPFAVPASLYANPCGKGICDGLPRAFRVLDSYEAGLVATPKSFKYPNGVSSLQPYGIARHGAAFFSVPTTDPSWQGKTVYVRAEVVSGQPLPHFRLFRINDQPVGSGKLTPEPVCQSSPDYTCPVVQLSDGRWFLGAPVKIQPNTVEVVMVAGATEGPATFTWSFGPVSPQLSIIEPTASTNALAGTAADRRYFVVKLSYRDAENHPIDLPSTGAIGVDVTNTSGTGGGCSIDPNSNNFFPYPLGGGVLYAVVLLPKSCYPATASGTLDLKITIDGVSAAQPQSIAYGSGALFQSVMLALDKSASMTGVKLEAEKIVAKAVAHSFLAPDANFFSTAAGVVTFNQDADTNVGLQLVDLPRLIVIYDAIDKISPSGQTSIGDALFESQSALAAVCDVFGCFGRTSIVLVTDGVNTEVAVPSAYYANSPGAPPGDGTPPPWFSGQPLDLPERLANKLATPVISSVAIGQGADLSALQHLAKLTNGTVTYVPTEPSIFDQLVAAVIGVADSAFAASYGAGALERVSGERAIGGSPVEFPVEPGAQELRVGVVSGIAEAGVGVLLSPSGQQIFPTTTGPGEHSSSFLVAAPEPGAWTLVTPPVPGSSGPSAFVDAAVRSPVRMLATADVDDVLPLSVIPGIAGPAGLDAWAGSDLRLRAAVLADQPATNCVVRAFVTLPDDVSRTVVTLRDDGRHGDGFAGDGLFGATFTHTGRPGFYSVRIKAACALPAGFEVRRESNQSVPLRRLADDDGDGLPDRWQQQYGLSGGRADDDDHDGLTNAAEFEWGTNPNLSDSDGAGEADGAEVAAGRDPRDPDDDRLDAPVLAPTAGNDLVYLPAGREGAGVTLQVERAASAQGPFVAVAVEAPPNAGYAVDRSVVNDVAACYRMRAEGQGTWSAWSAPACVTPRLDPVPPELLVVSAPHRTHTRDVTIALTATDTRLVSDGVAPPIDLGVAVSGVDAMREWFGPGQPEAVAWQPVTSHLALRLPDSDTTVVQIEARDAAGNVSRRARIGVARLLQTPIDKAIADEERAEDAIDAGDLSLARSQILASLPEIEQSFAAAVQRLASSNGHDPDAVHVVVTLAQVHGLKVAAAALIKPKTLGLGVSKLHEALTLEVGLAAFADEKGITL